MKTHVMLPRQIDSGSQSNRESEIVLFLTQASFPVGTATTQVIGLIARTLLSADLRVRVLILDASEVPDQERNIESQGEWNGIPFEYLPGTTRRAKSFVGRRWLTFRSYVRAAWEIAGPGTVPRRKRTAFMFVHGGFQMLLLLAICRTSGVRSIIDFCEWRPALPDATWMTRLCYNSGLILRLSDGIVAISSTLEQKALQLDPSAVHKLFRRSNVIDLSEFETSRPVPCAGSYLVWSGMLPGYEASVAFIIRAYSKVFSKHPNIDLVICGRISLDCKQRLLALAALHGIPESKVRFTGFISRDELLAFYQNAAALLIPLENDYRARARFPFKLGEYLSAARPVVTSAVGDIPLYLTNGTNGMLCPPEDEEAFASAIVQLIEDPDAAERMGRAGYDVARQEFDYRRTGARFVEYLRLLRR